MSRLEVFKDNGFDAKIDNNFEQTEGKENKENADDVTKKQKDIADIIKQAKDRMQMMAETEIEDADSLLAGLTGEKNDEKKPDENLQKHLAQGDGSIIDANGDGIPDGEQAKDTNAQSREDEENALAQQPKINAKPTENNNSHVTHIEHGTQFGNKDPKQSQKKSSEAGAETSGGLE